MKKTVKPLTMAAQRDRVLQELIAVERKRYAHGDRNRHCAYCGSKLMSGDKAGPRHGDHWFCSAPALCRRRFYKGQFRRREED